MVCDEAVEAICEARIINVRNNLCSEVSMAEQLVTATSLVAFFERHERYAKFSLLYPDATVKLCTVPFSMLEAYRKTWQDKDTVFTRRSTRKMDGLHLYESSCEVARVSE